MAKNSTFPKKPAIPGARMPVAAFPVKMTDGSGAKRHSLVAPPSVAAILAQLITNSGQSVDLVAAEAGMPVERLRRILDGRRRVRRKDARLLAAPLGRWEEALWGELGRAQIEVDRWAREDRRRAK